MNYMEPDRDKWKGLAKYQCVYCIISSRNGTHNWLAQFLVHIRKKHMNNKLQVT